METKFAATAAALPPELPPATCNLLFELSSVISLDLVKLHGFPTGPNEPQLATLNYIYNE